jgi:hypothetical protein
MPPDRHRVLLHKARQDELVLERLLGDRDVDDDTLGFHAQQAAEKLLKAALASRKADYPRTHNLGVLIELLSGIGVELPADLADIDRLTPFGTPCFGTTRCFRRATTIVRGGSDGFGTCEASSRPGSADRVERNDEIDGENPSQRPRNEPSKEFPKSYPAPARKGGMGTQGAPEAKPQNAVLSEISVPCEMMRLLAEESEKPEYPRQGSNLRPTV